MRATAAARPVRAPRERVPSAPKTATPRPNLRVVSKRERAERTRRRRARAVALLLTGALVVGMFGLVAFHVALAKGQLELDHVERQLSQEQERYERERLEVAELEAPERIVAVAQQRIGMVPAAGVTYLSPTGVATVGAARPRIGRPTDDSTGTSWPDVKRQLAGRP